jgi:hypothetical protein
MGVIGHPHFGIWKIEQDFNGLEIGSPQVGGGRHPESRLAIRSRDLGKPLQGTFQGTHTTELDEGNQPLGLIGTGQFLLDLGDQAGRVTGPGQQCRNC